MANETISRYVFRDDRGEWIETHVTTSREHAIRLFCYPALRWEAYEADGFTCTEEPMQASDRVALPQRNPGWPGEL